MEPASIFTCWKHHVRSSGHVKMPMPKHFPKMRRRIINYIINLESVPQIGGRWMFSFDLFPLDMLWQALAYPPLCATTITLFWFPNVLRFIVSTCICSKWASPSAHLQVPQPLICWGANHQGLQTLARLFRCYFRWRAVVPWFRAFNPCFATSRRHKSLWERRAQ